MFVRLGWFPDRIFYSFIFELEFNGGDPLEGIAACVFKDVLFQAQKTTHHLGGDVFKILRPVG